MFLSSFNIQPKFILIGVLIGILIYVVFRGVKEHINYKRYSEFIAIKAQYDKVKAQHPTTEADAKLRYQKLHELLLLMRDKKYYKFHNETKK